MNIYGFVEIFKKIIKFLVLYTNTAFNSYVVVISTILNFTKKKIIKKIQFICC